MATDQQVDNLIRELQEFVRTLDTLQRTQVQEFNQGVSRMVAGMALMTRTLDKSVGVKKNESKYIEEFTKKVKEATKATEKAKEATEQRQRTEEEIAAESLKNARRRHEADKYEISDKMRQRNQWNDYIDTFGKGITVTGMLRQRFEDLGGNSLGATVALKAVTAGFEGLIKATTLYASAIYRGERGALVSAKAFTSLVGPMSDLATTISTMVAVLSWFGPAGMIGRGLKIFGTVLGAVGVGTKIFSKVNEIGAEQADKLFTSFRSLSEVGAAGAQGMDGVFNLLQTLGMSVAEIEQFNELIKQNAQTLGFFGAGAERGAREFARVAGTLYKSRLGEQLEMLGLSAQEQREVALSYMHIQAKTGQMQLKNTDQLVKESGKFAMELDLAAQLTGQTRREQAKAQEQALTDERFRQATIAARARGDEKELARLERYRQAAAVVGAFDPTAARGMLAAGAGRGALTTPEAVAAEQAYQFSRVLNDPNIPITQALATISENAKRTSESLAPSGAFIGTIKGIQTDIIGIDNFVQRMKPIIDAAAKQGMTVEKFLQTDQGRQMAQGGATKLMTQAGRNQQGAALIMDAAVDRFNVAVDIHAGAAQTFKNAAETIAQAAGIKPTVPTVGGITPGARPNQGQAPAFATGAQPGTYAGPGQGRRLEPAPDYISRVKQLESGGQNIANKPRAGQQATGAFGYYQIIPSTYKSLVLNAPTGSILKGTTFEDMKTRPELQEEAMRLLTQHNARLLSRSGLSTSDAALYMSHMLGYGVASKVLQARASADLTSVVPQDYLAKNGLDKYKTVGEIRQHFDRITGGKGYQFGGVVSGPKSGYLQVLHGTEAIVPLPDGKTIPVQMPDFAEGMGRQIEVMRNQVGRLDELVGLMSRQVVLSSKLLQATNN